jgi:3-oxoacyl-[acyl-carrier protein] reductase
MPTGITINNMQPGPMNTDLHPVHGDFADTLRRLMALPLSGTAVEVAALVAYLACNEGSFATGAKSTWQSYLKRYTEFISL